MCPPFPIESLDSTRIEVLRGILTIQIFRDVARQAPWLAFRVCRYSDLELAKIVNVELGVELAFQLGSLELTLEDSTGLANSTSAALAKCSYLPGVGASFSKSDINRVCP